MYLSLGGLQIGLYTNSTPVTRGWAGLFPEARPVAEAPEALPPPTLALHLEHRSRLPPLPAIPPVFKDRQRVVDVYAPTADRFTLHYLDGALISIALETQRAEGIITTPALEEGRLEDITYTSLAPLLRRHGRYLVHAFAASWHGRALLLIGPSGSGKTTTGLSLIMAGWHLLANDIVLLRHREGRIDAYPTPGIISVRPPSLALLPALRGYPGRYDARLDVYNYATQALSGGEAAPAPVRALCFPAVTDGRRSKLAPQPAAVTLARLMEQSVDRWDTAALPGHLALLQMLTAQAEGYALGLGPEVEGLPSLLARLLRPGAAR